MSNLPPGVTGMEPQIAGYPEVLEDVECGAQDVEIQVITRHGSAQIEQAYEVLSGEPPEARQARSLIQHAKFEIEAVYVERCQFKSMDWTVQIDGNEAVWTCPLCETEHRREIE